MFFWVYKYQKKQNNWLPVSPIAYNEECKGPFVQKFLIFSQSVDFDHLRRVGEGGVVKYFMIFIMSVVCIEYCGNLLFVLSFILD